MQILHQAKLLKKVLGFSINENYTCPWEKIKFKIQFKDEKPIESKPLDIDFRIKHNKRIMQSYIDTIKNEDTKNLIEAAYQGTGKGKQISNVSLNKRLQKIGNSKHNKSSSQLKQDHDDSSNLSFLIEKIIKHEILPNGYVELTSSNQGQIKFLIKFKIGGTSWVYANQIKIQYQNNQEKLCNYILNLENLEDFETLSKIHLSSKPIFFDFLGQNKISLQKLLNEKRQKSQNFQIDQQNNEVSPLTNEIENVQIQYNPKLDLEEEKAVNENIQETTNELQVSQLLSQPHQDLQSQVSQIDIFSENKNCKRNFKELKKQQEEIDNLQQRSQYHIYRKETNSLQNFIDGLNIFSKQQLFQDQEQINELFNTKTIEIKENEEDENMIKEFSLKSLSKILYDFNKDCFLSPEFLGYIEEDQILRFEKIKFNIGQILLIGEEKPYIIQYSYRNENQIGMAIIRKCNNKWYLFDNKYKQKVDIF